MKALVNRVQDFVKDLNGYRIAVLVVGMYFAVAGYSEGLFNSISVIGFVFVFYQFGYLAANRDRELNLNDPEV